GHAGSTAQVKIEPGGRESTVHCKRNRRSHRQAHRLQQEGGRTGIRAVAPPPHRGEYKGLACIRWCQAERSKRHLPCDQGVATLLRCIANMPIEGSAGLYPGTEAAVHLLQA